MEKGNQPLSRQERRKQERTRKRDLKHNPTVTRRELLTAFMPGGWIPKAVRIAQGKDEGFTRAETASAIKDIALAGGIPLAVNLLGQEQKDKRPLKEKVLSFTWKDADNPEKLKKFVEDMAEGYLQITQSPRLQKSDLIEKITFYTKKSDFIAAVQEANPNRHVKDGNGYADYNTKRTFINGELIKKQSQSSEENAGIDLLGAIWHEWGHLDIESRNQGEWINNAGTAYFYSPNSRKNEPYRKYRGGEVFTDTYYGFSRFEEAWNETVIAKMMGEEVGLKTISVGKDYYPLAVDILLPLTKNIPFKTLYNMHATSDFEGFAKFVGQMLPGNDTPLIKGKSLFIGIHNGNIEEIRRTGALDLIPLPPQG